MEENSETSDWKARQASYEKILQLMENPSSELLSQLKNDLPQYISDNNPTCQRVALQVCEQYFKQVSDIEYDQYASIFLEKCLNSRQQNIEIAINLLKTCIRAEPDAVLPKVLDQIESKQDSQIMSRISVITEYLSTLTQRDAAIADDIIEKIEPLSKHKDLAVKNEVSALIASASIISGKELESPKKSPRSHPETPNASRQSHHKWETLISSQNWMERKNGFEELLSLISPDFPPAQFDRDFLIIASNEKHVQCESVIVQIIEKCALVYKNQIIKRLREFINPLINMMKKRQSRISNLQSAFDALANNVVPNPYEPPFSEHLIKMMTSGVIRLREEAVEFVNRNKSLPISQPILDMLQKLTSDPAPTVREGASNALDTSSQQEPPPPKPEPAKEKEEKTEKPEKKIRASSPDAVRRSFTKKRSTIQTIQAQWENWVNNDTLQLLNGGQWLQVTKGLEQLREQFDNDPNQPALIVTGLSVLFTGKTFTPKVMSNLMQQILFYMRQGSDKMTDEAITAAVNFCVDKIAEKRFEQNIFEILDQASESTTSQHVFNILYPHLSAKSPATVSRIENFFVHHLQIYGADAQINLEEFANNVKPLSSHGDALIRKAANECMSFVPQSQEENVSPPQPPSEIPRGLKEIKPKPGKSVIPVRSNRPTSPPTKAVQQAQQAQQQAQQQQEQAGLFTQKQIQSVGKMSSILENRRGLEECENMLTKMLEEKGPSCYPASEFQDIFARFKQWMKDPNTNIVFAISKIVVLSMKLLQNDQITNISNDFLCDIVLLFNYVHKGIRNSTIAALTEINQMHPTFVKDIFLVAFPKLNVDGRKAGILFIRDLDFDMTVSDFCSFIVTCLADKSEEFRNAAMPLIQKFCLLPDSIFEARQLADQFLPAKKNSVLSRLQSFEPQAPSVFSVKPTKAEKDQRESTIDPFLPVLIKCDKVKGETLDNLLTQYLQPYFAVSISENPAEVLAMLLDIASTDFSMFSLILDLVLLWMMDFVDSINFQSIVDMITENKRVPTKFELSILIVPVLENVGEDEEGWKQTRDALFTISDDNELIEIMIKLLSYHYQPLYKPIFQSILRLFKEVDSSPYISDLDKALGQIEIDCLDKQNLMKLVKDQLSPVSEKPKASKPSICILNEALTEKMKDSSIFVYQWIVDLMSSDVNVVIQSCKTISTQMKNDSSIFQNHADSLLAILITKMHLHFTEKPMQSRLCKYISYTIHSFFSETSLKDFIPKEYIQQLIYELLTHLSNGILDQVISQVLNGLMITLIDNCSMHSFMVLLAAVGEFDGNNEAYSSKWTRLALKCLEACGNRMIEIGNVKEICHSLLLLDRFFEMHKIDDLGASIFGSRVLQVMTTYCNNVVENYGEYVNAKENTRRFPPNSTVLKMIAPLPPQKQSLLPVRTGSPTHRALPIRPGSPTKPTSSPPLRQLRPPRQ